MKTLLLSLVIYSLFIPFALLDIWVGLYQTICFGILGIKKVRRGDFIIMDRGELAYLDFVGKLNCNYCAYAKGILALTKEVAAITELYFCPIKHRLRHPYLEHSRSRDFFDYGDQSSYERQLLNLRTKLTRQRN